MIANFQQPLKRNTFSLIIKRVLDLMLLQFPRRCICMQLFVKSRVASPGCRMKKRGEGGIDKHPLHKRGGGRVRKPQVAQFFIPPPRTCFTFAPKCVLRSVKPHPTYVGLIMEEFPPLLFSHDLQEEEKRFFRPRSP